MMEKLAIPARDMVFIDALRELIRTGAMAAPGLELSPLIDLPVVYQRAADNASPAKRSYLFIRILQQVIKQRLEGREAETASILFGFEGHAGAPIQDRYRAVAKLYNPHWTWENYRKEPLTRHLLAVYLALKREADLGDGDLYLDDHPRRARSGLIGQDWAMEQFDGLYNFPSTDGQPIEAIQTRRLRAICDKIDIFRHHAYVRERGVSSVPHVSLLGPGTVRVIDTYVETSTDLRIYITEVTFPKPISYGESIEFTLIKHVDTKLDQIIPKKGWDWYGLVALPSPAQSIKLGLNFPTSMQPKAAWRYEDIISGLVRPGEHREKDRLAIDGPGLISSEWTDLSAGYSYGIALDW